ncbi:DExH-box ATP-dependent RNA helicase DExH12-like [Solanum lycopersicum]|uniref:DExH-box ATP-dependent RNA helicase DExH12-like n=1 Tax=Solanum lycopersicum TaxID=4081 RepID=UPI00374A1E70
MDSLNFGTIASYYNISQTTIERFSSSVTSQTNLNGLLEILASASEFDHLPIRPGEEESIKRLIHHLPFSIENPNYTDPHLKANALLQAHLCRRMVVGNLVFDQREVILSATRLVQAMVDVISSNGWLSLTLVTMEVCQMVTQGLLHRNSMLLQLPYFTEELVNKCQKNRIETVFDLAEMEDDDKCKLLHMSDVQVQLLRDTEVGPVIAPRYPGTKEEEGWWLVIGDTMSNQLLAIKRVTLQRKSKVKLDFAAPAEAGTRNYTLYFMCDSYKGCDQEYKFTL